MSPPETAKLPAEQRGTPEGEVDIPSPNEPIKKRFTVPPQVSMLEPEREFFVDATAIDGIGRQLKNAISDPNLLGQLPANEDLEVRSSWLGDYAAAQHLLETCKTAGRVMPSCWHIVRMTFGDVGDQVHYCAENYLKAEQGTIDAAGRTNADNDANAHLMNDPEAKGDNVLAPWRYLNLPSSTDTFPIRQGDLQGSDAVDARGYNWADLCELVQSLNPSALEGAAEKCRVAGEALSNAGNLLVKVLIDIQGEWSGSVAVGALAKLRKLYDNTIRTATATFDCEDALNWHAAKQRVWQTNIIKEGTPGLDTSDSAARKIMAEIQRQTAASNDAFPEHVLLE